jgi:hypothetical protein
MDSLETIPTEALKARYAQLQEEASAIINELLRREGETNPLVQLLREGHTIRKHEIVYGYGDGSDRSYYLDDVLIEETNYPDYDRLSSYPQVEEIELARTDSGYDVTEYRLKQEDSA